MMANAKFGRQFQAPYIYRCHHGRFGRKFQAPYARMMTWYGVSSSQTSALWLIFGFTFPAQDIVPEVHVLYDGVDWLGPVYTTQLVAYECSYMWRGYHNAWWTYCNQLKRAKVIFHGCQMLGCEVTMLHASDWLTEANCKPELEYKSWRTCAS
jgi:hypothetical protein